MQVGIPEHRIRIAAPDSYQTTPLRTSKIFNRQRRITSGSLNFHPLLSSGAGHILFLFKMKTKPCTEFSSRYRQGSYSRQQLRLGHAPSVVRIPDATAAVWNDAES